MKGNSCSVFVMDIFLLIVLFASPAQSTRHHHLSPTLPPPAGSSTNTSSGGVVGSTAASDEKGSKGCDLVFCTRTSCELAHGGGSVDCFCCEPEYPNAACFRTRAACLAKCPLCNSSIVSKPKA